jgi:hypothetical protein
MKITLEFKHPCELIDLLEKLAQCYVSPNTSIVPTALPYDGLITWESAYKIFKEKGIL